MPVNIHLSSFAVILKISRWCKVIFKLFTEQLLALYYEGVIHSCKASMSFSNDQITAGNIIRNLKMNDYKFMKQIQSFCKGFFLLKK